MGEVYLCRSAGGQKVAVKVIRRELADDPQFRARFRREVAAARKVNGLYTAHVVDADTGASEPWLATAFLDAPSLANEVREHGPMSPVAVARLAAALAEGLSKIHVVGLVHRDLKPSNVLLASDGPRIIDFGIAWSAEAVTLTPENGTVGSPGYMAPEQADPDLGKAVGPPSDIFSLGAVLCFAATGRSPWGNGSTATLIYRAVHSKPNLGYLPAEIRPLVAQCLAKNPAERPTPEEILTRLGDEELLTEDNVRETAPDILLLSAPVILEDEDLSAGPIILTRTLTDAAVLSGVDGVLVPTPTTLPERDPATSAEGLSWAELPDRYAFPPRGSYADYEVFGHGDGAVLMAPAVTRELRSAAEFASQEHRITGGLLYGHTGADGEGQYLVVEGFLEARPDENRGAWIPPDGNGAFPLSEADQQLLRDDAARMYSAALEVGWWRSFPGPADLGPGDLESPCELVRPGGVGLLVFGSGLNWGIAYVAPDGQIPGSTRSYITVPEPAPAPHPLREPDLGLASADVVPEPAAMPELDAGPEPEPDREPAPAAPGPPGPMTLQSTSTPLVLPTRARRVSSVQVSARERRIRPRNPDHVGPNTPTDVKIVVGGLVVVSIIAAIITGVLLNNAFIAAIAFQDLHRVAGADHRVGVRVVGDEVDAEPDLVVPATVAGQGEERLVALRGRVGIDGREHAAAAALDGTEGHWPDAQPPPAVLRPGRRAGHHHVRAEPAHGDGPFSRPRALSDPVVQRTERLLAGQEQGVPVGE
jgi:hypothetical protein